LASRRRSQAPVTRRSRTIRSEVPVGRAEGLGRGSVVNVDNVLTVPEELLEPDPIGRLAEGATRRLDAALRWALDIRHRGVGGVRSVTARGVGRPYPPRP
jgi:mRNA-degrading endonuclease toxin of MazEF toxin-antitoxin module